MEADGTYYFSIGDPSPLFPSTLSQINKKTMEKTRHNQTMVEHIRATVSKLESSLVVSHSAIVAISVVLCLIMIVMILVVKLFVGAVSLSVRIFNLKPEERYKFKPLKHDEEMGAFYPKVLVQIPMYNEKEVYKCSIGAACGLKWQKDRLIIQVLDDSTDPVTKDLVKSECERRKSEGINLKYEVRDNRKGYKAGALKEGMKHDYVQDYEYVAMFDADFQPESDFLLRTVPFLMHNSNVALVQSRWRFGIYSYVISPLIFASRDVPQLPFQSRARIWIYHALFFLVLTGQQVYAESLQLQMLVGGRIAQQLKTGIWQFELPSVAGSLFILVNGDVHVKSELPSTFKAFRFQQHRWSCGPANLFKKMLVEIIQNKKVSIWKKVHIIYDFFFVGKIVVHIVSFIYYCTVIPLSVFFPEVVIPYWGVVYVPIITTLCKSVGKPSSFYLVAIWVLFENVMSLHQLKAALTGLFEAGRVNEWVVTEKLGDAHKTKSVAIDIIEADKTKESQLTKPLFPKLKKKKESLFNRFHKTELVVGVFLFVCGYYDAAISKKGYFFYLFVQGIAFFVVGFGYIGT